MNHLGFIHFLFYLLVTSIYVYAVVIYDTQLFRDGKYEVMGFPFDSSYGGRAKFLTYNNIAVQLLFFSLSTLNAFVSLLITTKTADTTLRKLTNFIYVSFAFPFAALVSIIFWLLYYIDRALVYPTGLDDIMPSWLNHALHTLPIVSILIEAYLTKHKYPSFIRGVSLTTILIIFYISWTLYIAFESDQWIYGILKVLTPVNRALFIATQSVFVIGFYKFGNILDNIFWPKLKTK